MMRLPKGIGVWTERLSDLGAAPGAIAEKAAATGLGHVAVKNADGMIERDHDLIFALGTALRAHGIELWVWPYAGYNEGASDDHCRGEGRVHGRLALNVGATGLIPDIETDEVKGSLAFRNNPSGAAAYIAGIREVAPDLGLGVTSYWHRGYHPSMPWGDLLAHAFNSPQVYYTIAKIQPGIMLQRSLASFGSLGTPAYPLAGDAQAAPLTGASIRAFAAACRAKGLNSFGFYHWAGAIDWPALKEVCAMTPSNDPGDLKVVTPSGDVLDCHPTEEAGVTRVDLRPVAQALGAEPVYKVYPDGRRRIYLKPSAPASA